jgi:hypothetical protein
MPTMPLTTPANKSMREDMRHDPPVREMIIELLKTHEATKRKLHAILDLIKT